MDYPTLIVGFVFFSYGLASLFIRKSASEKISKLGAMKQMWGEQRGYYIHVLVYTIAPAIFGLFLIYLGSKGRSFF